MQCWNCQFENIPGLQACARCGSTLSLEAVAIEPPRASRLHLVTWIARVCYRAGRLVPEVRPALVRLRFLLLEPVSWRALAWSIVPGLGHLKTNRSRLGRAILVIWLILLAMTVLSIGTTWTWLLVSGMVVTHAVAVLSLFAANLAYERLIVRAAFGALLFFCLNLFVYDPARWFCTRFVSTLVISNELDGSVARRGDGLLVAGPWLRPDSFERGDFVVCRIQGYVSSGYVIRPGYNVDRVVGVPGDRIQLRGGVLLVNGTSPPKGEGPLGEVPLGTLELVLGHDEYLVLPSFLRREALIHVGPLGVALPGLNLQRTLPAPVIRRLTLFQGEEVLGRVLLRLRPLSRFGRLE